MNNKYFLFFLLTLLFPCCLDEFNFERPDSIKGAVSIQGKLTKGNPSHVKVILREVFDFFNTPRFLSASKVYLIDESGNELLLTTRRQGFFNLDIPIDHPFFKVDYGNKYKIRVEGLKGTDYESEYDELFPAPIPDDFYVQETTIEFLDQFGKETSFDQLNFYLSTPLKAENANTNSRLVWEINGVSKVTDTPNDRCRVRNDPFPKACYASYPPVKNHLTFDGMKASKNRVDDVLINESNYTNLFAEGYYMIVYQQSVSETAFNYWEQVGTVVNRTGTVFQEPAGELSTNLRNLNDPDDSSVYGLFYATEEHAIRLYVSPELGRNQVPQCPLISRDGTLAEFCCNCLNLSDSTAEKPEWWEEE